nr:hypothetical protein Itr_chr01CG07020 [Ipomoea trifida]
MVEFSSSLKFPVTLIANSQPTNVQLTVTTGNRHLPDHPHKKRRAEKSVSAGSSPVNANRWSFVSGRVAVSQGCGYGDRERERKRYRKSRRRESVFYREIAEREEQNGKKGASERENLYSHGRRHRNKERSTRRNGFRGRGRRAI